MLRLNKILHACNLIGILMILLCIILSSIGSMAISGFGVDSSGKLYIGRRHQIEVYQDGTCLEKLPIPVRRGWAMAVTETDKILVVNGSTVYTLELDGTVINEDENVHGAITNGIRAVREIVAFDGSLYHLRWKMFWPTITKNGDVVYRVPFVDVLVKITLWLVIILFPPEILYNQLKPLLDRAD